MAGVTSNIGKDEFPLAAIAIRCTALAPNYRQPPWVSKGDPSFTQPCAPHPFLLVEYGVQPLLEFARQLGRWCSAVLACCSQMLQRVHDWIPHSRPVDRQRDASLLGLVRPIYPAESGVIALRVHAHAVELLPVPRQSRGVGRSDSCPLLLQTRDQSLSMPRICGGPSV